jgi:hypothetical protein
VVVGCVMLKKCPTANTWVELGRFLLSQVKATHVTHNPLQEVQHKWSGPFIPTNLGTLLLNIQKKSIQIIKTSCLFFSFSQNKFSFLKKTLLLDKQLVCT